MSGVSLDTSPSPAPVSDDINDIRLALRGGSEFAARAQALDDKVAALEAATERNKAATVEYQAALAQWNVGTDVVAALANARQLETAMQAAYSMAEKVQKAVEVRADELIKAAAASAAAEIDAAKADRAKAADVLAAANTKLQEAQAKCDAADQRGRDADLARIALQDKIARINSVLAAFAEDFDVVLP